MDPEKSISEPQHWKPLPYWLYGIWWVDRQLNFLGLSRALLSWYVNVFIRVVQEPEPEAAAVLLRYPGVRSLRGYGSFLPHDGLPPPVRLLNRSHIFLDKLILNNFTFILLQVNTVRYPLKVFLFIIWIVRQFKLNFWQYMNEKISIYRSYFL